MTADEAKQALKKRGIPMNDEMKVKRDTRTDLERNLEHFEQSLNVIEEQVLYARDLGRTILKSILNKDIKMKSDEAKQALLNKVGIFYDSIKNTVALDIPLLEEHLKEIKELEKAIWRV